MKRTPTPTPRPTVSAEKAGMGVVHLAGMLRSGAGKHAPKRGVRGSGKWGGGRHPKHRGNNPHGRGE